MRPNRSTLRDWGIEHGVPLFIYAILSVSLSWPTGHDFSTEIVSSGGDARHNLWLLWHVRQAILGEQSLFFTSLLYYPLGASLLTHGVGPVVGVFALPFWPWGAEAAYNGAMLVGLWLTGYGMYLLARALRFELGVALFAGILLMASEMPLAGLYGHIEKTSLVFLPLSLLTALHTLDLRRSSWWALATALVLLLTLLHAGWHFVLATFAIGFFATTTWFAANPDERRRLLQRGVVLAIGTLALVGPLLVAILAAASHPAIAVDANVQSLAYRPDLIEFLLPSRSSQLFGPQARRFLARYNISWSIETTVSLSRTGILLCLVVLLHGSRTARRWLWFVLLCLLLALGPSLKVLGIERFTEYRLPIVLPYALLTALPGLDFMRKPGQFMAPGLVGFAIAASFGLTWLTRRFPRHRYLIIILAIVLVLVDNWPRPWPQEQLRSVPAFYQQIAQDDAEYGVFDLPIRPAPSYDYVGYSSHYQMYQMVHRKGIAAGYFSRSYTPHPLFPCLFARNPVQPDVWVDGEPSNCYTSARYQLARHGYRYVVWHKPQDEYLEYKPGSWAEEQARTFVTMALGDQPPIVDDNLVRVYALPPADRGLPDEPVLMLHNGWHQREANWRWASSPATLEIVSPRAQPAMLEITPHLFHDSESTDVVGESGDLIVQTDAETIEVSAVAGEIAAVPIELRTGSQMVTLTLTDGNFRPSNYGQSGPRLLSFAVRALNLRTRQEG